MFKHKAQTKPSSNLKGSARKALLTSICSSYGLDESTLPADTKLSLLPKDVRHARSITHTDKYKLLIYSDEVGRPLWFKFESGPLDKLIFPTVLTLWKNPFLANGRALNTPLNVLPVIQGGADLMIPGCFPPYPDLIKGQPVVYLSYPEQIPLGVGVVLVSQTNNLSRDLKGKAAQTIHTIEDSLVNQFKNETVIVPGLEFDYKIPNSENAASMSDAVDTVADGVEKLTTEESQAQPEPQTEPEPAESEKQEDESDEESFTPQEADDFFMNALLLTIYQFHTPEGRENTNPNLTTDLELPISASQLLDSYVVPNLAIPVSSAPNLTIKATSHKKTSKFLKAMEKLGLIATKEMRDGLYVTEFSDMLANTLLQDFIPYTIRKKKKADSSDSASASSARSGKNGSQMVGLPLWKPHSSSSTFFNTVAKENRDIFSVQSYYDTDELKQRLVTYINAHQLVYKQDKRQVIVDEVLIQALGLAKKLDTPCVPGNTTISRDKIVSYLQSQCTSFHLMYSPEDIVLQQFSEYTSANKGVVPTPLLLRVLKPAKGQIPQVHIKTERRGGNKTVTTVTGLESFGISPALFAEELRKACAGSTSVNSVKPGGGGGGKGNKNQKGKGPVQEQKDEAKDDGPKQVLVQGPQVKAVETLLLKKGLRPAWIETNDKDQKKKGGKK